MRQGKDVTIIAIGIMVKAALDAADDLQKQGIDCTVLNLSTLKPTDEEAIIEAAVETGAIVTAEEHLEHGGLASLVARIGKEPGRYHGVRRLERLCHVRQTKSSLKDTDSPAGIQQAVLKY
jgi:transketolase C-terminal domain/subunit